MKNVSLLSFPSYLHGRKENDEGCLKQKEIPNCLKGKHHPGHKITEKQNRSSMYVEGFTLTTALSDCKRKQSFIRAGIFTKSLHGNEFKCNECHGAMK